MQRIFIIVITISISLLAGCAVNQPIVTDYDRDADFKTYRTYYWSDEFQQAKHPDVDNPLFYNTLNKKRLKKAIQSEMNGRGYEMDPVDPDLLIDARIVVDQKNQTVYTQNMNPYFFGWYYPPSQTTTTTSQKEGGVVIELIDKDEKQLIWQGFAPDVLQLSTQDKEAQIRAAVSGIFAEYNYRAGS